MADEYIKRKEAIVALHGGETVHIPSLMLADKRIAALPAADVVERKKGEWVGVGLIENTWRVSRCTACGYQTIDAGAYCTNCGADMRLKEDGQN